MPCWWIRIWKIVNQLCHKHKIVDRAVLVVVEVDVVVVEDVGVEDDRYIIYNCNTNHHHHHNIPLIYYSYKGEREIRRSHDERSLYAYAEKNPNIIILHTAHLFWKFVKNHGALMILYYNAIIVAA
jgi:hypothetical protein